MSKQFSLNNNNNNWKYQQTLFSSFNNELMSGINQGLSLYNPEKDLTLYKNTDLKPLENINLDNNSIINNNYKDKKDKKDFDLFKILDDILSPISTPIIGGDIGTDLVNLYHYSNGDDKEFKSKTIEFYTKPLEQIYNNYSNHIFTLLGLFIISLIIYKKI